MNSWPNKDPDEVLDYDVSWILAAGETLSASSMVVVEGTVVKADESFTPEGVATVWLTGGAVGEICLVRNRVTTSMGRTYDTTTRLRIQTK